MRSLDRGFGFVMLCIHILRGGEALSFEWNLRVTQPPGPAGGLLSGSHRPPGPDESACNFTAELEPRYRARYRHRAISQCLPPSLLLSILCWSYCRVVALVYCAGLQHEPSNLDAAALKAIHHDIFLPSWRAVMVTCFEELLWRCETLCILGDTINHEVNRNGE